MGGRIVCRCLRVCWRLEKGPHLPFGHLLPQAGEVKILHLSRKREGRPAQQDGEGLSQILTVFQPWR
jgi:hypothetical protein